MGLGLWNGCLDALLKDENFVDFLVAIEIDFVVRARNKKEDLEWLQNLIKGREQSKSGENSKPNMRRQEQ